MRYWAYAEMRSVISVPPQFSPLLVIVVGCAGEMNGSYRNRSQASTHSTVDEQGDDRHAVACGLLEEECTSCISRPVVDTVTCTDASETFSDIYDNTAYRI